LPTTSFPIYNLAKGLARYLPTIFLRRYYTAERMTNLVYCDLVPRGSSTQLNLGQVTLAQVCSQVINLSPLQIELDRAQLVMQCGGASIELLHLSPRISVGSGAVESIAFRTTIHEGSAQAIAKCTDAPLKAWLTGTLTFNCVAQNFSKAISLSEIYPNLINVEHRRV
jgi:hypothetical protein